MCDDQKIHQFVNTNSTGLYKHLVHESESECFKIKLRILYWIYSREEMFVKRSFASLHV